MINFVPKNRDGKTPWREFGSSREEYLKWIPHICGICCLKMIGDTLNLTNNISLYILTMMCYEKKGFTIDINGNIHGVYHYPLLELAIELGMQGSVEGKLDNVKILEGIKKNGIAILSISLKKDITFNSHLIIVHSYLTDSDEFIIHDCASILGEHGENIKLHSSFLESISNNKGLILYKNKNSI